MTFNEFVGCPHCGGKIVNDGRLAGTMVVCPHCRGPMQMPAAAPDFFTELATTRRVPTNMRRKRPAQNSTKVFAIVAGGLVLLIGVVVGIAMFVGESSNVPPANPAAAAHKRTDPWKMGYEQGYAFASIARAAGDVEHRQSDEDYHGSIRFDMPEEMGKFRDGFRVGYKKGWNEN
jgi:hypothetical protein